MIPLQVRIVGAVVILALVAAFSWRTGANLERGRWIEREAKIAAEHADKLQAATERARETERAAAERYAAVDQDYQKRLQEATRATDAALAAVRSSARRLSIPAVCPGGGSAVPDPAAPAGERDGAARAELSDAAARFLVGLASEADQVVEQLRACQAIVMAKP